MKLAVPTEIYDGEFRWYYPDCVPALKKMVFRVFIQKDAGISSSFTDNDYKKRCKYLFKLADLYKNADIVVKIQRPTKLKSVMSFCFLKM